MRIVVCISDKGDARLARTLRSLEYQTLLPNQVLIERRGTVAGSRNLMFRRAVSVRADVIAFIDTDQEAPRRWLERLAAALATNDFACGPTKPHPDPDRDSRYETLLGEVERRHYARCATDQTIFPMGNSAWRASVLFSLAQNADFAPFDERFWMGGEDYDINIRATRVGFRGAFAREAWVWHDQTDLDALRIMRRKLRYCYGGALALLKNRALTTSNMSSQEGPVLHWLEAFQKIAQAWGLLIAVLVRRFSRAWRVIGKDNT